MGVRARASGCVPAGVRVCVRVPVSASACVRWRVRALRESIHSRANDPAILATSLADRAILASIVFYTLSILAHNKSIETAEQRNRPASANWFNLKPTR